MLYLHYGADQRKADATRDSTQWLAEVLQSVSVPVGVGCFDVPMVPGPRAWARNDRDRASA